MSSARANYVKIGVFVVAALFVALVMIVVLGASSFNENVFLAETYVEDSVQGLDVGSAVKFRGMPFGKIKDIGFVWTEYDDADIAPGAAKEDVRRARRYTRIVFSIDMKDMDGEKFVDRFRRQVDDGLKVFIKSQGITGLMYLDLDFDRGARPPVPVPWQPHHLYVPYAPGLGRAIEDVIRSLAEQLESLNVSDIVNNLNATITDLRNEIKGTGDLLHNATEFVARANTLVADFEKWTADANLPAKADAAFALVDHLNAAIDTLTGDLGTLVRDLDANTSSSAAVLTDALYNLRATTEHIEEAARKIKERPSVILDRNAEE